MTDYKCCILANPEGDAWNYAQTIFDYLQTKGDGFELNRVLVKTFRNGEPKPKIEDNIRRRECFFIHDSNLDPSKWMAQIPLINEAMCNSSAETIANVFPFHLFARQDRKDESRVPKSVKVVADLVQKFGGERKNGRLMTYDIHCPQIELAYNIPFENLPSYSVVNSYLKKNHPNILEDLVIMSPDEGGVKRAVTFGKYLGNNELIVAYKIKDKKGKIVDLKILGDVKGRKLMMVDDIVDSGNTLITACNKAREMGALEVYAYITHGLFTEGSDKVTKEFDKFFVGDTVKQKSGLNAEVIPLAKFMGEAIYRNITGQSLTKLFDYDFIFDAA